VIIALTCLIAVAVLAFVLLVRPRDLSEVEPPSPFAHLDERKASIYENLRDLQFEYRVGKLSDGDYQQSKKDLQKELAAVMAEVDKLKAQLNGSVMPPPAPPAPLKSKPGRGGEAAVCSACGAKFEKELKFCGECGKPMKVATK
jgi:hypothetical protein